MIGKIISLALLLAAVLILKNVFHVSMLWIILGIVVGIWLFKKITGRN